MATITVHSPVQSNGGYGEPPEGPPHWVYFGQDIFLAVQIAGLEVDEVLISIAVYCYTEGGQYPTSTGQIGGIPNQWFFKTNKYNNGGTPTYFPTGTAGNGTYLISTNDSISNQAYADANGNVQGYNPGWGLNGQYQDNLTLGVDVAKSVWASWPPQDTAGYSNAYLQAKAIVLFA